MNTLTARQQQVAALLARGLSNQEIAHELGIAHGTVKIHLNAIYQRLGVANRTACAVLMARAITSKGNPQ